MASRGAERRWPIAGSTYRDAARARRVVARVGALRLHVGGPPTVIYHRGTPIDPRGGSSRGQRVRTGRRGGAARPAGRARRGARTCRVRSTRAVRNPTPSTSPYGGSTSPYSRGRSSGCQRPGRNAVALVGSSRLRGSAGRRSSQSAAVPGAGAPAGRAPEQPQSRAPESPRYQGPDRGRGSQGEAPRATPRSAPSPRSEGPSSRAQGAPAGPRSGSSGGSSTGSRGSSPTLTTSTRGCYS